MTVADLKKILDTMPNDAPIIINVDNVDADWTVTDSGVMTKKDGSKVAYLTCYDYTVSDDSDY